MIALIDCNNFFASCERIFRPDLAKKPVAVLSNNDGCIVARSNEVKALGVPMGAPLFQVRSIVKANKVQLFSANFALYGDMSQRITELLHTVAPRIEVYSIDESFIDLKPLQLENPEVWAADVCKLILQDTGIPVSVGIAPNKTLAKAAAEYAKKEKASNVHAVQNAKKRRELLDWLAVEDVWGIGRRLAPKLRERGVATAGALAGVGDDWALQTLSIKGLGTIKELRGERVIPFEAGVTRQKSITRTRMFGHAVREYHQLESAVASFTATAAAKLRAQKSVGGSVVVYLRPHKRHNETRVFATKSRLSEPSADTGTLIQSALKALESIYDPELAYSKAGVIISDISDRSAWQLSLVNPDKNRDKKQSVMDAYDSINRRFGPHTMWHAVEDKKSAHWQSKREHRSPAYTTSWNELPKLRV
jgi:DNA polymerase V